jgi:hypothetical protein
LHIDDDLKMCPFSMKPCGVWCALFTIYSYNDHAFTGADITLCHRECTVSIENFTDERED